MKKNDCLISDIQNLCNAVSDWLIQKFNNPIKTDKTISYAFICLVTVEPVNSTDYTENDQTYNKKT